RDAPAGEARIRPSSRQMRLAGRGRTALGAVYGRPRGDPITCSLEKRSPAAASKPPVDGTNRDAVHEASELPAPATFGPSFNTLRETNASISRSGRKCAPYSPDASACRQIENTALIHAKARRGCDTLPTCRRTHNAFSVPHLLCALPSVGRGRRSISTRSRSAPSLLRVMCIISAAQLG